MGHIASQSSDALPQNGATSAIDDDMETCSETKNGAGEYWQIHFNQSLTVAGVSFRLNGGQ